MPSSFPHPSRPSYPDMPLAPVDSKGTELFYEDGGAPPDSVSYLTLVLLHGVVFHGTIFQPMFAYARDHNMRLVAVTLRDYPGSTPFASAELDALQSFERGMQASFIRDRGYELASFLAWYIETKGLPPTTQNEDGDISGGLAILGWSWGNCITLSLLAHAESLPVHAKELLDQYLRTIIIFDPSHIVFGTPDPPFNEVYAPLRDPVMPPEQFIRIFSLIISGYYSHAPSTLSSIASLTREQLLQGLVVDVSANPQPTSLRMSATNLMEVADFSALARSQSLMMRIDRSIYRDNTRAALGESKVWPRLRLVLVWCDMSPPDVIYAAWDLQRMMMTSWPPSGRKVIVKRLEGANHFPHWDQPQATLKFLSESI